MKTIAFCIQKGGTGKTTSAAALASGLQEEGKSVLLIDLDPQRNLSYQEGLSTRRISDTLYDVWENRKTIQDVLQPIKLGLDIITGGAGLLSADTRYKDRHLLQKTLQPIQGNYDFCLIDSPPYLGVLATMAITAADALILPMECSSFSAMGLMQFREFLQIVAPEKISVSGILITKINERTISYKALESQIVKAGEHYGIKVFDARIHLSAAISNAQNAQKDFFKRASRARDEYRGFTKEVMQWQA